VQIVVNTRLLLRNRLDGMGWFAYQALKRITTDNPSTHFVFLFDRPYDESFIFSGNITPIVLGPPARHPVLYYLWFQHSVKGLLNRMKPDLFLSPDGFLALGAKCRQLPVIHDINFVRYPKDSKWLTSRYYNYYFPKFAHAATRIATVSEFSKKEIADAFRLDRNKIDVVYNGIHPFFRPLDEFTQQNTRKKFSYGKPYFLFVGSMHPRKNLVTLIKAFSMFKEQSKADTKLLLAGPGFWGMKDIHQAIEHSSSKNDIICTERLSDEELALVTGSALALTYVPYYEGFGIPLVEAMQAGVPVLAGNRSSLPEICGDAALLVDPMNAEEIKNGMTKLYSDPELRAQMVAKGHMQREKFSWDRTASLLWESMQKSMVKTERRKHF
jgi:glycosyltransferase involved in cell wall biosynthesis